MTLQFLRVGPVFQATTDRYVFMIRAVVNGIELVAYNVDGVGYVSMKFFPTVAEATAAAEEMARE